jgi:hypothetical protein
MNLQELTVYARLSVAQREAAQAARHGPVVRRTRVTTLHDPSVIGVREHADGTVMVDEGQHKQEA